MDMSKRLRAGILGYGRMGRGFVAAMRESELWEVAAVYDICGRARELARQQLPEAAIYDAPDAIFCDRSIDAVGLFTLADARPGPSRFGRPWRTASMCWQKSRSAKT